MYCKKCATELVNTVTCPTCGATAETSVSILESEKTTAFVAYISTIGFLVALILHSNKKTSFGAFHLRQSLGMNITFIVLIVLLYILGSSDPATFESDGFSALMLIVNLSFMALWITGLVNVYNGQEKPLPVIGEFYKKYFEKWFN